MDSDSDSDSDTHFSEDSEETDINEEELFNTRLQRIRENNPETTSLYAGGDDNHIHNLSNEVWEQLGRDISNNTYFKSLNLNSGALSSYQVTCLFRGLTSSNSIEDMQLYNNGFSVAGLRSMVPFLQNATNLNYLDLDDNNIQSEGFNMMFRSLRDSPIETLRCSRCSLESIEIDKEHMPHNLQHLHLDGNNINTDGCRELAKLLQDGNTTLTTLNLNHNNIDDDGVEILVDALQNNTSLKILYLKGNNEISIEGMKACLRLVNNISSIKANLKSNHTLRNLLVNDVEYESINPVENIQLQKICGALAINSKHKNDPEAAGRAKVMQTQLHSVKRAELTNLLGVTRSLCSEINPLHLPEVLALVGLHHGQEELYVALKSSIAGVISTVNRKECIQQRRTCLVAELAELDAELAAINESELDVVEIGSGESRSSKRRRKWWWGLWDR
eukprot:scaffold1192_cov83-Skeletonema_dohrnii-CCMP3373.AAC.3